MISYTVTYPDWNDNPVTEKLHFNLTKYELSKLDELRDQLEAMRPAFEGAKHELSEKDMRQLVDVIVAIAEKAYGERPDERRFVKRGAWERLQETGAWDQFLWELFNPNPIAAVKFMLEVVPQDVRAQGLDEMREDHPDLVKDIDEFMGVTETETPVISAETGSVEAKPVADIPQVKAPETEPKDDTRPAWIRENRDPTPTEVRTMTSAQLQDEYIRKISQ
jgi:hypothetical protein